MTGLMIKDALVMRKTLRLYALFLLFYSGLAVLGVFPMSVALAMVEVIVMVLPISSFSYDEAAKWDRYAAVLPVGRTAVVKARYLFLLLVLLAAAAIGLVGSILASLLAREDLGELLATLLVSMGLGLMIADIMLPVVYQLGPERARPWMYVIIFAPIVVLLGGAKLGLFDGIDLSWLDQLPELAVLGVFALVPLVPLVGMLLSCWISCRIYARKEF